MNYKKVDNVSWRKVLSWEEPEAICSACQGKGCIHCNQTGKVEKDSIWAKPSTIPKEASLKLSWEEHINVASIPFNEIPQKEGIVLFGAGGDLNEWIYGVTQELNENGIAEGTPEEIWDGFYKLTTTGGRTDLVMPFKENAKIDLGKMAIWRLRFGDCSWISDYRYNYANQFLNGG